MREIPRLGVRARGIQPPEVRTRPYRSHDSSGSLEHGKNIIFVFNTRRLVLLFYTATQHYFRRKKKLAIGTHDQLEKRRRRSTSNMGASVVTLQFAPVLHQMEMQIHGHRRDRESQPVE